MNECPDEGHWEAWADGALDSNAAEALRIHLGRCPRCQRTYEAVVRQNRLLGLLRAAIAAPDTLTLDHGPAANDEVLPEGGGRG